MRLRIYVCNKANGTAKSARAEKKKNEADAKTVNEDDTDSIGGSGNGGGGGGDGPEESSSGHTDDVVTCTVPDCYYQVLGDAPMERHRKQHEKDPLWQWDPTQPGARAGRTRMVARKPHASWIPLSDVIRLRQSGHKRTKNLQMADGRFSCKFGCGFTTTSNSSLRCHQSQRCIHNPIAVARMQSRGDTKKREAIQDSASQRRSAKVPRTSDASTAPEAHRSSSHDKDSDDDGGDYDGDDEDDDEHDDDDDVTPMKVDSVSSSLVDEPTAPSVSMVSDSVPSMVAAAAESAPVPPMAAAAAAAESAPVPPMAAAAAAAESAPVPPMAAAAAESAPVPPMAAAAAESAPVPPMAAAASPAPVPPMAAAAAAAESAPVPTMASAAAPAPVPPMAAAAPAPVPTMAPAAASAPVPPMAAAAPTSGLPYMAAASTSASATDYLNQLSSLLFAAAGTAAAAATVSPSVPNRPFSFPGMGGTASQVWNPFMMMNFPSMSASGYGFPNGWPNAAVMMPQPSYQAMAMGGGGGGGGGDVDELQRLLNREAELTQAIHKHLAEIAEAKSRSQSGRAPPPEVKAEMIRVGNELNQQLASVRTRIQSLRAESSANVLAAAAAGPAVAAATMPSANVPAAAPAATAAATEPRAKSGTGASGTRASGTRAQYKRRLSEAEELVAQVGRFKTPLGH